MGWIVIGLAAFGILLFLVAYTDATDVVRTLNPAPDVGVFAPAGGAGP